MSDLLKIWPIAGEVGRYHVESRSLVCSSRSNHQRIGCIYTWSRKPNSRKLRNPGDPCPRCGRRLVKAEPHLCDVNMFDGIGKCSCERWRFSLGPLITRMTQEQRYKVRRAPEMRCQHLQQALVVDALLTIERRQNGNGEQEGE